LTLTSASADRLGHDEIASQKVAEKMELARALALESSGNMPAISAETQRVGSMRVLPRQHASRAGVGSMRRSRQRVCAATRDVRHTRQPPARDSELTCPFKVAHSKGEQSVVREVDPSPRGFA